MKPFQIRTLSMAVYGFVDNLNQVSQRLLKVILFKLLVFVVAQLKKKPETKTENQ